MKISQRIRAWLQEGEDILTSLLGLIIAISGLIAFADVFSSGKALAYLPWLLWVWIITQAIAVDYQFYITTKRQFTASNVDPLVYWARWVLIAVLGALIVMLGAIFVASETSGDSISASMGMLGIPNVVFLYARAAAPVLLLFVIAVDHALDRKEQPIASIAPDVLNVIIERLDTLSVTVTQLTNPSLPALPEPEESPANLEPIYQGKFTSKEQQVAAILSERPGATPEEVAQAVGCSVRTAEKWIQRLQGA